MDTLSSPWPTRRARYDAVVVGSGYGGAVLACRLARAGLTVAVLERGRELHPGQFPDRLRDAAGKMQVHTERHDLGPRSALFDFRMSRDVGVLVGCGLGGTSLINANVALRPEPEVFDDPRWPTALRGGDAELEAGYGRARHMLGATNPPTSLLPLPKFEALAASADELRAAHGEVSVYVSIDAHRNHAGVDQGACTRCGDCVAGCNVGAKNTVLMNYLPDAVAHGADVFTEISVRHVERRTDGDDWDVVVRRTAGGEPERVRAGMVVLGAGTLGSTEILLRSRAQGLAVSTRLGQRMSGNGDFLAFAYNTRETIDGMGKGARVTPSDPVGPCISGMIDRRPGQPATKAMIIQEGAIPSALVPVMPVAFLLAALRARTGDGLPTRRESVKAVLRSFVERGETGPLERTQTFLAMGSDDDRGQLDLDRDRPVLRWDDAAGQRELYDDDETLAEIARNMGGTYLRSPVWRSLLGNKYVTVHPLGGCDMADDATDGVVDERGRVFAGTSGRAVHPGLYVADGAIVPTALGANPSLTITALAERIAALALAERDLPLPLDPITEPFRHETPAPRPTLTFRERMAGKVRTADGARAGRIELLLQMETDEVEALIADLSTPLRLHGTVVAPDLWERPLPAVGTLSILSADRDVVDLSKMRYEMTLDPGDGRRFTLVAVKDVGDDPGWDAWRDTTTAAVEILDDRAGGAVFARAEVRISLRGFLRLLASMRVHHAAPVTGARLLARFGTTFTGALFRAYGGVLAQRADYESIAAPPPVTRPLRVTEELTRWASPDGTWHDEAPDDAALRLRRFRSAGDQGAVLVAPGFAMATSQFLCTTTPTNLTEYLVEAGYDVWLFDYRAGTDLPSAGTDFTLDDIARTDWPRALAEVQRIAGVDDVHIVAHCVGSMTALMSVLAGARGVRSIVSSQVTLHPVMHWFSRFKARIHLPDLLAGMGARTVKFNKHPTGWDRLLDVVLRLNPLVWGEECHNPSCRWIFGFFGPTHRHDQLNADTHQAITELFGVGDLKALEQIGVIVRHGHVVDALGGESYLPFVDRMSMPVTFLAGDRNRIFYPETSLRTFRWLEEHNGKGRYDRIVLKDYAHLDALIGKRAHEEVFPTIVAALHRHDELLAATP